MTGDSLLLEARNLTVVRGGVQVLDIPSLILHEKEVLSLIGPNGAGKSTLLLALACLLQPTTGEIRYRGEVITGDRSPHVYRRRLAMVFQEPLLFDTTVFENVAAGLKIRGMARDGIRDRVMNTLGAVQYGAPCRPLSPQTFRRRSTADEPGARLCHSAGDDLPR